MTKATHHQTLPPTNLQSGMVDNFIDRKHGREAISYPDEKWQHESLKETLDHGEDIAQDAADAGGCALIGFDVAGVVVAFHFEHHGLTIAIVLGAIGGIYPDWRATKMQPVEALRYE